VRYALSPYIKQAHFVSEGFSCTIFVTIQ